MAEADKSIEEVEGSTSNYAGAFGAVVCCIGILLFLVGIFYNTQPTQEDAWFFYGNAPVGRVLAIVGLAMILVGAGVAGVSLWLEAKKEKGV